MVPMTVPDLIKKLQQLPASDKIAYVRIDFGDGGIYEHPANAQAPYNKKQVPDICPRCDVANTPDHRKGALHTHYRRIKALLPYKTDADIAGKYGLSRQRIGEFRRRLSRKIRTAPVADNAAQSR
jgi:hypothetical protein